MGLGPAIVHCYQLRAIAGLQEPEEAYDRITELCKTLFKVPMSVVTFVDKDRVWFKSVQGLPGIKQVHRRDSLCSWVLLSRYPEALVVSDLREDVRFKDYPIVTDWPHVRFYAACPLVSQNNLRIGTLCILDLEPREFSAESTTLLAQLASMVMREVERKRAMNDALCNTALRSFSGNSITHDKQGLMLCDMATPKWSIYLVNDAWQRVTGISQELAAGSHFWDLLEPPAPAQVQAFKLAVEQRRNFELRVPLFSGHPPTPQLICVPDGEPIPSAPATSNASSVGALNQGSNATANSSMQRQHLLNGQRNGSKALAPLQSTSFIGQENATRRRSIGGFRYVRFQFRSVSSCAMTMSPSVSIPPALMNRDKATNFYWGTVDVAAPGSLQGDNDHSGYHSSSINAQLGSLDGVHAARQRVISDNNSNHSGSHHGPSSSSDHTGYGSEASSLQQHPAMRTTFSLLPEDNPFQDITIGSLLGWGSYGRVHRGYWNGSLVAVKVLEQVAGDFNPCSSLEPLLHHRLSHPNIVAMFDVCTQEVDVCEDGRPLQEVWMVLEFCNKGTLSEAITRGSFLCQKDHQPQPGQVNMLRALATGREIAAALEYLHSQNVLHGDLNGNNILLTGTPVGQDQKGFTAKVADFGLSRLLTPESEKIITRTHGTITHMAPEVIVEATHSKAADVYSFGVVMFELLSGSRPYHGMHYAQIVSSITSGKILLLLQQQASKWPEGLLLLLMRCLATRAVDRPTFKEVHQKLLELELQNVAAAPQQQQQQALKPAGSSSAAVTPVKAWPAATGQQQGLSVSPGDAAARAAAANDFFMQHCTAAIMQQALKAQKEQQQQAKNPPDGSAAAIKPAVLGHT
eukprot:GHRR01005525.1.p1 GENE.GHRR01005525.1~~GHRR01005525.1.p1  ORF type:complete len:858 (+),score=281.24 GHRR01005525.1:849-3422(+)